jgi:sulfate transport system permease protein
MSAAEAPPIDAPKVDANAEIRRDRPALRDPRWARWAIFIFGIGFLTLFVVLPIVTVGIEAFRKGAPAYLDALSQPDTISAIDMTLSVAAIAVPLNCIFGIAAAWALGKFDFRGKTVVMSLIDLPFSVSPVISGMVFLLLFGLQGWFGGWLRDHHLKIVFALPGLVLATMFVTLPFVARELIPLMQEQGTDEEEAARMLGAGGWRIFFSITLPNIKWALLYGVLLCNARAMGEFGAVSVVSGHIRGLTNTLPLQVDILYNEYNMVAAFSVASLLAGLALVTLIVKSFLEWRYADQLALTRR